MEATDAALHSQCNLPDGRHATIRPLTAHDTEGLFQLFQRLPSRERWTFKDDVTSGDVVASWCRHIDYARVVPLVAELGGQLVAEGTLHRTRRVGRQHVGEVRVVTDPDLRGKGLGSHLIRQLLEAAYALQMRKVLVELVEHEERDAITTVQRMGFRPVGLLRDHVSDPEGQMHDLVILEMDLDSWYKTDEASNF